MIDLLTILGPTASGKTALSIKIAKKYGGEIIAADSRTVYSLMDIGTAKPSPEEQSGVPHWGFDLVGPGQKMTVSDFKTYADDKITEIRARKYLPIIVGGSGLYIDAVLYNFSFAPTDEELRQSLDNMTIAQLQNKIQTSNLIMPQNNKNKRYLIRTLERGDTPAAKNPLPAATLLLGIYPGKSVIKKRIENRAKQMIKDGVIEEIKLASEKYGWQSEAMTAGIYKVFRPVIEGNMNTQEALKKFITSDMQLVKKQMTWFKRNPDIHWFKNSEQAYSWIEGHIGGKLK